MKGICHVGRTATHACQCEAASSRDLITNDLILRTVYESRRRPNVSIFEFLSSIVVEHLAAYKCQFCQILSARSGDLTEGWSFEIIMARKISYLIPKSLDVAKQKVSIYFTRRRTTWSVGTCALPAQKKKAWDSVLFRTHYLLRPSLLNPSRL